MMEFLLRKKVFRTIIAVSILLYAVMAVSASAGSCPFSVSWAVTNNGSLQPRIDISLTPTGPVSCYALEACVPAGLSVSSVSGSGDFDAASSIVRWGTFQSSGAVTFSYEVTGLCTMSNNALSCRLGYDGSVATFTAPMLLYVSMPAPIARCAPPEITPASGSHLPISVELTSMTPGSTIRYTLDGTPPTESSTPYTIPLDITDKRTLRAVTFAPGMNVSREAYACYDVADSLTAIRSIERSDSMAPYISIAVLPDQGVKCYALTESIPPGLRASGISHDGVWDEQLSQVSWGPFSDHTARTVSYAVVGRAGSYALQGVSSYDGKCADVTGDTGVVTMANFDDVGFFLRIPEEDCYFHGVKKISWAGFADDWNGVRVDVEACSDGQRTVLERNIAINDELLLDTRVLPDGVWEFRVIFKDTYGVVLGELTHVAMVNNSVVWHRGVVLSNVVWESDVMHVVEEDVTISSGAILTIEPGAVVKFAPGTGMVVEDGGVLMAEGNASSLVILTSLLDDDVGGDTNQDGLKTLPRPGDWSGISTLEAGVFNQNVDTHAFYLRSTQAGTLAGNEVWMSTFVYEVTENITVPTNVVLTIQPGALVKFHEGKRIYVAPGGELDAVGTPAQPIIFTSVMDDTIGGDSNGDGDATIPTAGSWRNIYAYHGQVSLEHCRLRFGGSDQVPVLHVNGDRSDSRIDSCLFEEMPDEAIHAAGGLMSIRNCVVRDADEALYASGGQIDMVNCSLIGNRVGIRHLNGVLGVRNSLFTESGDYAVEYSGGGLSFEYNNTWQSGLTNYFGMDSQEGSNGNVAVDPLLRNGAAGDYRLGYQSPMIDAGHSNAPLADYMNSPRYDDPRTANTGLPMTDGVVPDIGAYEFVETAQSDIDLVVSSIEGPSVITAGEYVTVSWDILNRGAGTSEGSRHDAIQLVQDSASGEIHTLLADEVLSSQTIGPGERVQCSATIRVPGGTEGRWQWSIQVNSRGEIFEGQNWTNNTALASAPTLLMIPELTLDGMDVSLSFTAETRDYWYKIRPGMNEDVEVLATASDSVCRMALCIRRGAMPTVQAFDIQQTEWNSSDVSAHIPWASSETCYLLVRASQVPGGGSVCSVRARNMAFGLDDMSPAVIGADGSVVLRFTGWHLSEAVSYSLYDSHGHVLDGTLFSGDSSEAFVTFNTVGLPVGTYDLVAHCDGVTVTQESVVLVRQATPGHVRFNLVTPGAARPGRPFTIYVEYENVGNVDAIAPLMRLETDEATMLVDDVRVDGMAKEEGVTGVSRAAEDMLLLAVNPDGPAGVLAPGARGRIAVRCQATVGPGEIDVRLHAPVEPTDRIDWIGLESLLKPAFLDTQTWAAVYGSFSNRMGSTMGQLNGRLADAATYFSRFGDYVADANALLVFELQQSALMDVARRYAIGSFGHGRPAPWDLTLETNRAGDALVGYAGVPERIFYRQSDGSYAGAVGEYGQLSEVGMGYELVEPDGLRSAFHADGRLAYWQDRNGNRLTCVYTAGRVTSVERSLGGGSTVLYDPRGPVSSIVDHTGRTVHYGYDASGTHLVSVSSAAGTSTYSYVEGQGAAREHALQSFVAPGGAATYLEYDDYGRVTNRCRNGGAEGVHISYPVAGEVRLSTDDGATRIIERDINGNVVRIRNASGQIMSARYDRDMNVCSVVGSGGNTISIEYDEKGNPNGWIDAAGGHLRAVYDTVFGRMSSICDALGQTTTYERDADGNMSAIIYPGSDTVRYEFCDDGRIGRRINGRKQTVTYDYDVAGLLTQKVYSTGQRVGYTYDEHENIVSVRDESGSVVFGYDTADRVTNVAYSSGRSLAYAYDGGGRRTMMRDQNGCVVRYAYDALGRLETVRDTDDSIVAEYGYDRLGRVETILRGNGVWTTNAYDAAGHLSSRLHYDINGVILDYSTYTYDTRGLPIAVVTPDGNWGYSYDTLGQLTNCITPSTRALDYEYDAVGNRLSSADDGIMVDYVSNRDNQYTRVDDVIIEYDDDGNLTSKTSGTQTWSYAYNADSKLVAMTTPEATWTFEYDLLNNLQAVVQDGVRMEYLIDPAGLGNVVSVYDEARQRIARCIHGMGLECINDSDMADRYVLHDLAGNITRAVGNDGVSRESFSVLPFGERESGSELPSSVVSVWGAMRFGDLIYMRNRFYDPELGRFISRDPIGITGGINLYRYADNAPVLFADARGLDANDFERARQDLLNNGYREVPDWMNSCHNPKKNKKFLKRNGLGSDEQILDRRTGEPVTTGKDRGTDNWVDPDGVFPGLVNPFFVPRDLGHGFMDMLGPYIGIPEAQNDGHDAEPLDDLIPWAPFMGLGKKLSDQIGNWLRDFYEKLLKFLSRDPNDILGPSGHGSGAWIAVDQVLPYKIRYENMSNATASAQTIAITNQLDPNLDWSTFELGAFSIGTNQYDVPPELQAYSVRIDMRPENGLYVDFAASFDMDSGIAIWEFTAIDPATGELTEDPFAGFLPPNTNAPCGEGYVTYTMMGNTNSMSGVEIRALAEIIFDVNEAILTPEITNRVDNMPPTSAVAALPKHSDREFTVSWSVDDGVHSGVDVCKIYVARASESYQQWLTSTDAVAEVFCGEPGVQYSFFSVARDQVGNVEMAPLNADAVTAVAFGMDGAVQESDADVSVLRWESASNLTYDIMVSTNLGLDFNTLAVVDSTPPETVYTDVVTQAETRYYQIKANQ